MDVFQGLPSNSAPLFLTSWEDLRIFFCRLPQVLFILGSNFQYGTRLPSYRSGRRCVLSPRDERTLVQKVQITPRTTAKDRVKLLEETGTKVSIFTVYSIPCLSARKKPLLQNRHKKSQTTVCNCTWGQRLYFLEKCPLV